MPTLDEIVNVNITTQAAMVSRAGFGVGLILGGAGAAAAIIGSALTKKYTDADQMLVDGVVPTDPEYLAAQKYFMQNPRPTEVRLGKRTNLPTQSYRLVPSVLNSKLYEVVVDGRTISWTSDSGATLAEICTGIAAEIASAYSDIDPLERSHAYLKNNVMQLASRLYKCTTAGTTALVAPTFGRGQAIADGTAVWKFIGVVPTTSSSGTYVQVVSPIAGEFFNLKVTDINLIRCYQDNADAGIAADLAAIWLLDKAWYALQTVFAGRAEVLAAAPWIESNKRIFSAASEDAGCLSSVVADDIMSVLFTASYFRTFVFFHKDPVEFIDAAVLGRCLPFDPGSETWAYKTLAGITADVLTPAQQTAVTGTAQSSYSDGKGGNVYINLGGINVTWGGLTAGREFIDKIRGVDALTADIQEHEYAFIASQAKVPMSDAGITGCRAVLQGSLDRYTEEKLPNSRPFLVKGSVTVTAPKRSELDVLDVQARFLNALSFSAQVAGAIHEMKINGTLTY